MFHGDTLYCETEILEVRESGSKPDRGVVKVRTDVFNQSNELVATFRRAVLVPRAAERLFSVGARPLMRQNALTRQSVFTKELVSVG